MTESGSTTISQTESSTETRSLGEIVGDISRDLSDLMRQEMDLAKTELKQELTKTGKGAGMFGGAGVAALMMLFFLSLALGFLLDLWMPRALAMLIVGIIWAVVAAVLAKRGRDNIKAAHPQLPTTQKTLKEDVQWAKEQAKN